MKWWGRKARAAADDAANTLGPDGPVIRLAGVSRVFKGDADEETWALRDVSVDINQGDYVAVSGPSG